MINPDHFGAYLEMAIFLAFGYLLSYLRSQPVYMGKTALRRTLNMLSAENLPAPKIFLLLFIIAVMVVALLYTLSRGAVLALSVSMGFCFLLLNLKAKRRGYLILIIPVILIVAYYSRTAGVDPLLERLEQTRLQWNDVDTDGRTILYRTGIQLLSRFPAFGSGLGTFPIVYPVVKAPLFRRVYIDYAHNDWLQMATDVGAVGFLIFLLAAGSAFLYLLRLWWRTDRAQGFGFGLGAIGGMLAMAVHSCFDFSLRMPINAMFLLTLFSLGWIALSMHRERKSPNRSYYYLAGTRFLRGSTGVAACCLLFYTAGLVVRYGLAEHYFPTQMNSTQFKTPNISLPTVEKALHYNHLNSDYWMAQASLSQMLNYLRAENSSKQNRADPIKEEAIANAFGRALILSPSSAGCWSAWGDYLWDKAQEQSAPQNEDCRYADLAFDRAIQLDPTDIHRHEGMVWFLLWWREELAGQGRGNAEIGAELRAQLKRSVEAISAEQPGLIKEIEQISQIKDLSQLAGAGLQDANDR